MVRETIMKRIMFTLCMMLGLSVSSVLPMNNYAAQGYQAQRECPTYLEWQPHYQFKWLGCCANLSVCRACYADYLGERVQAGAFQDMRCNHCRAPLRDDDFYWAVQDQNLCNQYRELCAAEQERLNARRAAGVSWETRKMIWSGSRIDACPRCHELIQKNGGCNHMTCRREVGGCGYDFCWVCMGYRNSYYGHTCNPISIVTARIKRHHPVKLVIGAAILSGVAYGAYRLHKHLNKQKPLPAKDVENIKEEIIVQPVEVMENIAPAKPAVVVPKKDVKKTNKRPAKKVKPEIKKKQKAKTR